MTLTQSFRQQPKKCPYQFLLGLKCHDTDCCEFVDFGKPPSHITTCQNIIGQ